MQIAGPMHAELPAHPSLELKPSHGRPEPYAVRARRGLAQGAGSRRVDALPCIIPANPVARRGLLTHDLSIGPVGWGLGRLGLDDTAISRL